MKAKKHNHRIAIAWGLLFILLSAIVLKDLHHHEADIRITAKTVVAHNQITISNDAACPICQFTFSPTEAATIFHLFATAILLGIQYCTFTQSYSHKKRTYAQLRAPPNTVA